MTRARPCRHVVAVPTWRRPEALWWALRHLLHAEEASGESVFLFIVQDAEGDPLVEEVVRDLMNRRSFFSFLRRTERVTDGGSFNILEALRTCSDMADLLRADWVHVVEEDTEVSPDYFSFVTMAHETFSPWAVSAAMCHNDLRDGPRPLWPDWEKPEDVFLHPYYQSVAVSLNVETVRSQILPHAVPAYYRDRANYVRSRFPGSLSGTRRWEQAGLVNRVMEAHGGLCLYPVHPRARHAGFYGHNRPAVVPLINGRPWREASLEDRVRAWGSVSAEDANSWADVRDTIDLRILPEPVRRLNLLTNPPEEGGPYATNAGPNMGSHVRAWGDGPETSPV